MSRRGASRRRTTPVADRAWLDRVGVAGSLTAVALVMLGLGVAGQRLADTPIREIAVEGSFRYLARDAVTERLTRALRGELMSLDIDALRRRIASDPWVDRVSIRRRWPDRLEITLVEQVPIAYWGEQALVNYRGEVFTPARLPVIADVPVLVGPDGSVEAVMHRYQELDRLLASEGRVLQRLAMDARRAWRMQLDGAVTVVMGQGHLTDKMERFLRAYRARLRHHYDAIERIDLRYGNGLAVQWQGAAPAPAGQATQSIQRNNAGDRA